MSWDRDVSGTKCRMCNVGLEGVSCCEWSRNRVKLHQILFSGIRKAGISKPGRTRRHLLPAKVIPYVPVQYCPVCKEPMTAQTISRCLGGAAKYTCPSGHTWILACENGVPVPYLD